MSDDQFTRLFKYMQDEFAKVDRRFEVVDARLDRVMSALDAVLKNQETAEQERLAMNNQLARHERWHHQLARKTGTELS